MKDNRTIQNPFCKCLHCAWIGVKRNSPLSNLSFEAAVTAATATVTVSFAHSKEIHSLSSSRIIEE